MARIHQRQASGRFERPSLGRTFGLENIWCPNPECGRGNPSKVGESKPEACQACGQDLRPGAKIGYAPNWSTLPTKACSEWVE